MSTQTAAGGGSPTVRRLLLGSRLQEHRERVGKTVDTVARLIGASSRSVARWEAGAGPIGVDDLDALCDLYVVTEDERAYLMQLQEESKQPGWWVRYSQVIRPGYAKFIGLESGAAFINEFAGMLVPGVLQTEAYMRAVMGVSMPPMPPDRIARLIEVRHARQREMQTASLPRTYILDASVLYRRFGGDAAMAEQLTYLAALAGHPSIAIRVLPFDSETYALTLAGFSILGFHELPPVACVELRHGDLYADGDDVTPYTLQFEALRRAALTEADSLEMISDVRGRFGNGT